MQLDQHMDVIRHHNRDAQRPMAGNFPRVVENHVREHTGFKAAASMFSANRQKITGPINRMPAAPESFLTFSRSEHG